MKLEHLEPINKAEVPQLKDIDDLHIIDYEAGSFHCTELFTHEGALRACAKTKEESIEKVVEVYKDCHKD